jgi:hypothetical protein
MKLIRIGPREQETPGFLSDRDGPVDVSAFGEDPHEAFFATAWLGAQSELPGFAGVRRYGQRQVALSEMHLPSSNPTLLPRS